MTWNWQQPDWPEFTYDRAALDPLERQFLLQSGEFIGACKHIGADATRDLQDLVEKGALTKTGALRHTRYRLNIAGAARK